MAEKMKDIIVLLPGITGSELVKDGKVVWGWSGRALVRNIFSAGGDFVDKLWVKEDSPTAETLDDGVTASRLLPDLHVLPGIWKIDGYSAVSESIKSSFEVVEGQNFFPFPYDWRRDNRSSARTLKRRTDEWLAKWRSSKPERKGAKLILVAHSMGGLVSRYFLELLEGWRDTKALITFGTPYRGSVNAIDGIANGIKEMGIFDLTKLARRLNSLHQLLPVYDCIDTGEGPLKKVTETGLPNAELPRIKAAHDFHEEIRIAVDKHQEDPVYRSSGYRIYPIIGHRQPTNQSARLEGAGVKILKEIRGEDFMGDGTVPRPSAVPREQTDAALGMFAATKHGSLQNDEAVLSHLLGVITGLDLDLGAFRKPMERTPPTEVSLQLADLYRVGDKIEIGARPTVPGVELVAKFESIDSGAPQKDVIMRPGREGWQLAEFPSKTAGAYRVTIVGQKPKVTPAADTFEIISSK